MARPSNQEKSSFATLKAILPSMTATRGKAAIYARISADKKDTRLGVGRQLEDCRKLCQEHGWSAVEYVDNDISAADPTKKRPEYIRLMADVAKGKIDVVVVAKEDRLHRQPIELEQFVADAKAAGMTKLWSVKSGYTDLSDSSALMILRIKGDVAAHEVDQISERVERKLLQRAKAGQPSGGIRPFGYQDDKITINEVEAALIREAAQRILEGGSVRSICADWNERGFTTVHGNAFDRKAVKKILISARMVGLRTHQGEVIGMAQWPAILDEAVWKQVCVILADPTRRMPRASRSYPLRGIATCALCGSFLVSRGDRRYGCVKDVGGCGGVVINADHLERHIFDTVLPVADHPVFQDILRSENADVAEQVRELVQADSQDQATLRQLEDDHYDKVITRQTFLRQSQRFSERIEARDARVGHPARSQCPGQAWRRRSGQLELNVGRRQAVHYSKPSRTY